MELLCQRKWNYRLVSYCYLSMFNHESCHYIEDTDWLSTFGQGTRCTIIRRPTTSLAIKLYTTHLILRVIPHSHLYLRLRCNVIMNSIAFDSCLAPKGKRGLSPFWRKCNLKRRGGIAMIDTYKNANMLGRPTRNWWIWHVCCIVHSYILRYDSVRYVESTPLYQQTSLLTVPEIYQYMMGTFKYTYHNSDLMTVFSNVLM